MKHPSRRFLTLLPAALLVLLSGCVGADGSSNKAQVRVLNVSPGYPSIDLISTDTDEEEDTTEFTGLAYGAVSAYSSFKPDEYTLKLRKTGASGNLLSWTPTLAEDTTITYVAYGNTNSFATLSIDETVAEPNSGYAKVQVLNTTSSSSLDVYLSGSSDSIDDVSATIAAATSGAVSSATTINSGTYRLRITGAGDKTDLRLDVPEITLASESVVSIILTDTTGGVLLNAVVLPQEGDPTTYTNTASRVRAAVGLSTGSSATVEVDGTNILSRRAARSYISDSYTLLEAGATPVNVYVDNVLVSTGSFTMQSGLDYTVFVWDTGGSIQLELLQDDNLLPTNSRAKVRLLNGMSGLGAPLTLAVDYSPVAEYVELGAASTYEQVTSGTEYQLDVTNANTAETLLTREEVTLAANGVYTYFLAGGGTSSVVGTLRKDR